jgi:pimeloyl-ACP methyl ester carboxylesterase
MTNDPSIHLTRWGNSGPIVVMIHGSVQGSLISGGRHFSEQEKLAARGWQIVVPDRPGHGRSPSPGRPDDGVLDGHWVAELMGEGAHLVGHSFGGLVALCAAAERPEAVRSLTLIEPAIHQLAAADPVVAVFFKQQVEIFTSGKSPAEILADFSKVAGIPSSLRSGRRSPRSDARRGIIAQSPFSSRCCVARIAGENRQGEASGPNRNRRMESGFRQICINYCAANGGNAPDREIPRSFSAACVRRI